MSRWQGGEVADVRTAAGPQRSGPVDDTSTGQPSGHGRPAPSAAQDGGARWHRPGSWPPQYGALAVYWLSSRLVILALLRVGQGDVGREVHAIYQGWYADFRAGSYPVDDVTWQYPPGAALVMLAPGLVPGLSYLEAFVVLTLAADAAVTAALLRAGRRRGRSTAGAWLWAGGLPLMLHLPYARYDLLVTAVAVAALLALKPRPVLSGSLAGIGAMIKVWPALAVLGAPRGRTTAAAWAALAASAAALGLLLTTVFRGALDFVSAQHNRGVEIESLGGSVLHVARLLGWPGGVQHIYGSLEVVGPQVATVARASLLLTAVAVVWLLLWRVRAGRWTEATPYDAALCAVLMFTVTSRVISPQYLVWLLGLSALCLTVRSTTQRPVAVLLLLAVALTTVDYPLFFNEVIQSAPLGVAVVVLRNALLLAAALLSALRLWRGSHTRLLRARAAGGRPGGGGCRGSRRGEDSPDAGQPAGASKSGAAASQPRSGPSHADQRDHQPPPRPDHPTTLAARGDLASWRGEAGDAAVEEESVDP